MKPLGTALVTACVASSSSAVSFEVTNTLINARVSRLESTLRDKESAISQKDRELPAEDAQHKAALNALADEETRKWISELAKEMDSQGLKPGYRNLEVCKYFPETRSYYLACHQLTRHAIPANPINYFGKGII